MARGSDEATFYYVEDGKLVDADIGIDSYGTGVTTLHFEGGKFTTSNEEFIVQLNSYADTASHPISHDAPATPAKKGS